jgi:hypothetical protein
MRATNKEKYFPNILDKSISKNWLGEPIHVQLWPISYVGQ